MTMALGITAWINGVMGPAAPCSKLDEIPCTKRQGICRGILTEESLLRFAADKSGCRDAPRS